MNVLGVLKIRQYRMSFSNDRFIIYVTRVLEGVKFRCLFYQYSITEFTICHKMWIHVITMLYWGPPWHVDFSD